MVMTLGTDADADEAGIYFRSQYVGFGRVAPRLWSRRERETPHSHARQGGAEHDPESECRAATHRNTRRRGWPRFSER
jgi:hypothetical protein